MAAPAVTLKEELVAEVKPVEVAVSVYPVPALSMESPEKVATPEFAVIVAVPESTPELGLELIVKTILALEFTPLPPES